MLRRALDLGYNFFDTAAQYGFGANETLLGNVLKDRRRDIVLASKAGMFKNDQGVREVNGRPDLLKKTCDDALIRLQTDVIDLYYLHRWDKRVPVEDSMGAMADLVKAGKVRTLGISEVSAATLRKAHAVHPITALQTEYSLWTRDAEVAVLNACRELNIAFVAFSPVARGFLANGVRDLAALPPKDIRLAMPRFQGENFARNLKLLDGFFTGNCARERLHVVSSRSPGSSRRRLDHLERTRAQSTSAAEAIARLNALINAKTVSGLRYNDGGTFSEISSHHCSAGRSPSSY